MSTKGSLQLMWPIANFDHSQVMQTIGQIILHFRFYRHKNDAYEHWSVGIIKPSLIYSHNVQHEIINKLKSKIEMETLAHFKVIGKKNADKVLQELIKKGFKDDVLLCRHSYQVEPISQYHVVIYRCRK